MGYVGTPVEANALVRFPDGRELVVQVFEQPLEGEVLLAVGMDDGWIADKVSPVAGHSDFVYMINVSGR